MSDPVFFDSWAGLLRVVVVGIAAYAVLIVMRRVSGKRTLSKMNAFDLVVTVALGSTLATVLLNDTVPLLEGVVALALLVYLQFAITWLSIRSKRLRGLIKSEPTLLVHDGRYLDAALRQSGHAGLGDAGSVVLETDGSITVVPPSADG